MRSLLYYFLCREEAFANHSAGEAFSDDINFSRHGYSTNDGNFYVVHDHVGNF